MRIPKFEDSDYTKCSICGKDFIYISKKCLHKLCDGCFQKKFGVKGARFSCPFCSKNNPIELSIDDYSKEFPLQVHFDCDLDRRIKINKLINKRRENFESEEEYNIYLEFIEKCIQKNIEKEIDKEIIKEIEKRDPQTQKEKEENEEKRKKDLEKIKYVVDIEKKKKTGGYDINKIYSFFGNFAKVGFIPVKG